MLQLMARSKTPTIGICMGEIGTPSRILAARFGAPFTYATFHQERALAPGLLSFDEMRKLYRYDMIDGTTEVYGVIADPVGHSLSPVIHNEALAAQGMNKVYVPFRVPRADLKQFLDDCPALGVKGLSVTIPHKEAAVALCTKADAAVEGIGATNTLVFQNGERVAYNTDYRAAMDTLEGAFGPEGRKAMAGKSALLLGAGGVARAIAYGLARRNVKVLLAARHRQRSEKLGQLVRGQVIDWDMRHSVKPDILINCTPVGMHPNVDESPYDGRYLRRSMIVFDTVYNPEQTLLIKEARELPATVLTGVEMFIRQAAHQYRYFTHSDPPVKVMRDALRRTIGPAKYDH
jgi:3-dehydroquinate dehydratase/shikimate dehydrogenase